MMGKKKTVAEPKADFGRHIVCSQQVFAHFAGGLGITPELALRLASCFGSGPGRADVRGCVTGGQWPWAWPSAATALERP